MLRLDLDSQPFWLDLGCGPRLRLRPLTTAVMAAARSDPEVRALVEEDGNDASAIALARAIARIAILGWEGVGDAEGNEIGPDPERIGALLDLWPVFEEFQVRYVAKGLLLVQEGNVSAPSPNGTSAAATGTVPPARPPAPSALAG